MSDDTARPIPVKVDQHIHPVAYAPEPPHNDTLPQVEVAKVLRVVNNGTDHARLFINGEPFPYATRDGFHIHCGQRVDIPGVTFTLAGWRVEVVDELFSAAGESADAEAA